MIDSSIISEATNRLVRKFNPRQIILFGSTARGTADSKSDIDLLVICPLSGKRRDLVVEMDRTLAGLGIARDIIILTPEEFERDKHIPGTVARPAWKEGKVLYEH
ncbi:MAG: nucleotidyltransferase domain-containing protein [Spirochaetes bacterium]|nr:nucleotidyltransferase domain-containing protein [Spirochaetota bacterium]